MAIDEHTTHFAGKAVVDWMPGTGITDPENSCYRVTLDWDAAEQGEVWTDRFAAFLDTPRSGRVTGLVVGAWGEVATGETSAAVVEAIVTARERLPHLTALFLGDITFEESEISWIVQSDVSPIFAAYPQLEHFRSRGGTGLSLGVLRQAHLKSLVVESGGLPASVVREVAAAELPVLEHLELWLGEDSYGWDGSLADLAPILAGARFPKLTYLGLRDSEIADELAIALADAPITQRLRVLDLSLGTLSDEGAAALLRSQAISRLQKLDIHHHYLSEEMVARLTGVLSERMKQQMTLTEIEESIEKSRLGCEVDASDPQKADRDDGRDYRYVAVGE
jgi:hypothetical protein